MKISEILDINLEWGRLRNVDFNILAKFDNNMIIARHLIRGTSQAVKLRYLPELFAYYESLDNAYQTNFTKDDEDAAAFKNTLCQCVGLMGPLIEQLKK